MNITPENRQVKPEKWARYRYNLTTNLGADGERLTGCDAHIALSRKVAAEGMVLLKNDGTLPLKTGTTVALFGVGTLEYIQCGGGSGEVYPAYVRNIYEGFSLKAPRVRIFEPVSQFYYDYAAPLVAVQEPGSILPEPAVPAELIADAAANADVAIIVIHRYSSEGLDRKAEKGDFYLTDEEQKLVEDVTKAFSYCVAVLNVGGMVDVSWIQENPKIGGALLAWQAGMEGGLATADILCGDVNPSGKLVDTFAKTFADYPSADTYNKSTDYVEYFEDIYVGYRYFETVPGAKEKVSYPFGYGLSYTTFELSKPAATFHDGKITIALSVTNTGNIAGKEVVQVYFCAPQGRLGKSKLSLAGFQKTKLLAPGEKEDITICFHVSDMASFDDTGKCRMSAYVLEQGQYRFFAGTNCRDLQQCDETYTVAEDFVIAQQLQQRCAPSLLSRRMLADGSFESLPAFSPVLPSVPAAEELSVPIPPTNQTIRSTALYPPLTLDGYINFELLPKPWMLKDVAEGKVTLEAFVRQLTDDELVELVSGIPNRALANTRGFGGVQRVGIPPMMTVDGPAGVRVMPATGIAVTAWPCATLIACTWDPELAYAVGAAGAVECRENGLAVWLTPAMNIHRNPLCGRNFEYFSEDPLVSGKIAAAQVRGIQSVGVAACVKHFACNNKEKNRHHCDSRVSERALREIYLRGFEICVKEACPWILMTSYNLVNGQRPCENRELLQGILRDEWGFEGFVTTDWYTPCNQVSCILAGADLRMPYGEPELLKSALESGALQRGHLQQCVLRLLGGILRMD